MYTHFINMFSKLKESLIYRYATQVLCNNVIINIGNTYKHKLVKIFAEFYLNTQTALLVF